MGNLGGYRPGSGRKPGFKLQSTLTKEHARELVRQLITAKLEPLIQSQMHSALGLSHLMMRDPKTGKFERITGDAKQIDKACKSKNAFWIYTKDPNVQAFTDLMNRCIDKPSEHISIAGSDGGPLIIQWQTPETETLEYDSNVVIDIEPEPSGKPDALALMPQAKTKRATKKHKAK